MSEVLELRGGALVEALATCGREEEQECTGCPFAKLPGGTQACMSELVRCALEEIQRMRNATSRIVERGIAELVRLAGEANTAVERGLYGVSDELVSQMQEHMTELSELGRETMIHMQPLGQTGTRVELVKVGGEVVYRREGFGDEEPGV